MADYRQIANSILDKNSPDSTLGQRQQYVNDYVTSSNILDKNTPDATSDQRNSYINKYMASNGFGDNTGSDNVQLFQPDLYPESGSNSGSVSFNNSGSNSNTYSGMDYDNPYIKDLFDKIQNSTNDMSGNIDSYTQSAADSAEAAARMQAKNSMPGLIDSLAQRGILNGKTGQKAIQGLLANIAEESAMKNYSAGMEGAKMKQSIPQILGQLANLGKYSQGSSSSTGTSGNVSQNESWSKDPSVPYKNMMDMYYRMMGG